MDFANKLLQEAHQKQVAEMDHHQKLLDYANWFEVTKNYNDDTTHFGNYFDTAKEMERVQADPATRIRSAPTCCRSSRSCREFLTELTE